MLLHLVYLLLRKKLQSVLNFGQNVSWNVLEIIPADLLDTLTFVMVEVKKYFNML